MPTNLMTLSSRTSLLNPTTATARAYVLYPLPCLTSCALRDLGHCKWGEKDEQITVLQASA